MAMMGHPSIAKVFAAGVTQTGRPIFVMELDGVSPIKRLCDEQQLSIRARPVLSIKVYSVAWATVWLDEVGVDKDLAIFYGG